VRFVDVALRRREVGVPIAKRIDHVVASRAMSVRVSKVVETSFRRVGVSV
jgi:hypothetical protein